jgi:predicted nucleic acid-binding Zn ribbon protein
VVFGVPEEPEADPVADAPRAAGREPTGPELARAVLDAARVRRESAPPSTRKRREPRQRGYSGAGPDPRDPALFGDVLAKLVKARGWQQPAAEGAVFGAWERVVGADVASHCKPIKLADGELTIEAESTAWATQLRLLAAKLLVKIAGEVGPGVVKKLHIHGPAAPSWSRGPRRVSGRGPRDTYG